jgi:Ca2+-binding RTX toxin-like protein
MHVNRAPHVEPLETRTLFAASAAVVEFLQVAGDRRSENTIVVADSADGLNVDVHITSVNRAGEITNLDQSFAKSAGFTRVVIRGGNRADVVSVGSEADPFEMDVTVSGRAGVDTITTGSGNDRVNGGVGADIIRTGLGNDVVHAGRGADQVFGGDGDDILWGGHGNDTIDAGIGNDKLGGILGLNSLTGGDGNDEFVVRSLERNPTNDFSEGTDTLTVRVKREEAAPAAE